MADEKFVEECIHLMMPADCSICNGRERGRRSSAWVSDREYAVIDTPLWCDSCGEQGVPMPADFMTEGCQPPPCLRCGAEQDQLDDLSGPTGWGD